MFKYYCTINILVIKMENGENKRFVVKVFQIYPVWSMGQLVGAVVCNDKDEADEIAYEIKELNINTEVEIMSEDFENDLWKEWAEDVERLARYNHYDVWGLNVITAEEYREKGLDFVEPDFDEMVYTEEGEFVGWFDAWKDAIVDAKDRIIYKFDKERNLVDNDGKVMFKFDSDGNLVKENGGE
jgi:hypothetical protein